MTLPQLWSSALVELERLSILLAKRSSTVPTGVGLKSELNAAKSQVVAIRTDEESKRQYRTLRLKNIPVPSPPNEGLHPTGARIDEARVSILYECWESTKGHARFGSESLDRIRRADMQVAVKGSVSYGARKVIVEDHWRVDTHYFSEPSTDPHPWVHYQRGGHAQESFSVQEGFLPGTCLTNSLFDPEVPLLGLMQSPAPRIATPPLDPACAIDFVLAQHSGKLWAQLWADPDYVSLIRTAQERLWNPWFELLNNPRHRRTLMPFCTPPKPSMGVARV